MAGNGSGATPPIRQRIAGFFRGHMGWSEFIDPRAHSWAKLVKSYAELPARYEPFFRELGAGGRAPLPYAVLMPTFRGSYGHPEPERLVCIVEGSVHVVDAAEAQLSCKSFAPGRVDMIEYGLLLLHSWITIRGQDPDGKVQSATVRFNSISDYLMAPIVDCLRGADTQGGASTLEAERAKFDYLARRHYKFRSYGRTCVRPGDTVSQTVFQPEIRQERLRVLGISITRLASPAHLCIFTNKELIDIRDDPGQRWGKGSPHGAIWTYIPRGRATSAALGSRPDGTCELSVPLQGGLCVRSLFDADKLPQLRDALAALT